jgi:hypothetical protein
LRDMPVLREDSVDITSFFNFYGKLKESQKINNPVLIKKASWWDKFTGRK